MQGLGFEPTAWSLNSEAKAVHLGGAHVKSPFPSFFFSLCSSCGPSAPKDSGLWSAGPAGILIVLTKQIKGPNRLNQNLSACLRGSALLLTDDSRVRLVEPGQDGWFSMTGLHWSVSLNYVHASIISGLVRLGIYSVAPCPCPPYPRSPSSPPIFLAVPFLFHQTSPLSQSLLLSDLLMKNILDKMCDFGQTLCTAPLSSHFCPFCRWRGWATSEEAVAQKGDGLCLRSHSKWIAGTEPTHKVQRVSMSPYGPPNQPQKLIAHRQSNFINLTHFPCPDYFEKSQKSCIVIYCINEPKMVSAYALFFLLCRLRLISLKACRSQTQIFIHLIVFKTSQTSRFLAS